MSCARFVALSASIAALSGCLQATRHSNTMVFGTNTVFGISAGTDATSTPTVTVGYKRQEAVVLPLFANTGDSTGPSGDLLTPCASTTSDVVIACKFQGTGDGDDTYSVLASFGAKFDATSDGKPKVGGEIAQYFATGHAARLLAERAGAAAVATGDAAEAGAISPEVAPIIVGRKILAGTVADNLVNAAAITTATDVAAAMSKLDTAVGAGTRFTRACAGLDKAACATVIRDMSSISLIGLQTQKLDAASKYIF